MQGNRRSLHRRRPPQQAGRNLLPAQHRAWMRRSSQNRLQWHRVRAPRPRRHLCKSLRKVRQQPSPQWLRRNVLPRTMPSRNACASTVKPRKLLSRSAPDRPAWKSSHSPRRKSRQHRLKRPNLHLSPSPPSRQRHVLQRPHLLQHLRRLRRHRLRHPNVPSSVRHSRRNWLRARQQQHLYPRRARQQQRPGLSQDFSRHALVMASLITAVASHSSLPTVRKAPATRLHPAPDRCRRCRRKDMHPVA